MTHLWDRLNEAGERLAPVKPSFAIVWQDPAHPDAPASITAAAPEWMAAALAGGVLPPIEQYHQMVIEVIGKMPDGQLVAAQTTGLGLPECIIDFQGAGGTVEGMAVIESNFSTYEPIGPMTEEQATEYLVKKDIPHRVWGDHDRINSRRFKIVPITAIPEKGKHRNAWELAA